MNKHDKILAVEIGFCFLWVAFFYFLSHVIIGGAK
jgi:hypothetical protein